MAAIVSVGSRGNNRAEVSLAIMPPSPAVAEDDDSMSPHLNTLQIANEKAKKKSELPPPVLATMSATNMTINGGGAHDNGPGDNASIQEPQNGSGGLKGNQEQPQVSVAADEAEPAAATPEIVSSTSQDEPPSYIPAHLYGSTELNARLNSYERSPSSSARVRSEEQGVGTDLPQVVDMRRNGHDSGQATPTGCGSGQATPTGYASGRSSGHATPTGYGIHGRIHSSSIPHLLSTSVISTDQQQQSIQSQLSFMGIDAALTPTIRSRDQSFAFSVDGDDSAFKGAAVPTPQLGVLSHPHQQLVCLKQNLTSPLEGASGSNLSSSVSLPSVVSPASQGAVPPYPSDLNSPPQKTAVRIDVDMRMLSSGQLPILSDVGESLDEQLRVVNAEVGKILPEILPAAGREIHATTKPPPAPNGQDSHRHGQMSSVVQPELYSAINSLERYNAGSFENKVMLAKARGTYGTQRAFPGVPTKNSNDCGDGLGTSMESGLESKGSSVSSFAGRKGSITEREEKQMQLADPNGDRALIDQIGLEHLESIESQPSESRLVKSKSSGNLDDKVNGGTPVSLGLLKKKKRNKNIHRSVTIEVDEQKSRRGRAGRRREKKVGVFRPSSDAYTPRMGNRDLKYKPATERASVEKMSSTMGTIQRPNFRDALRRVAIILHQHIVKIERRFSTGIHGVDETGLFKASMREQFNEDNFATPRYKCSMVRVPMARPGVVYSMRKIRVVHRTPTTDEIYEFAHQLFKKVQLSSECSIVCLIYVEKLMEVAKVPLVAETWRPIFMCGLLLASKVWQDLSSWNIEFASVYPQFSLDAINRLELSFLKFIKWDLYISSSLYAKYYFALRSLLEKSGFRDRYVQMVGGLGGIAASEALKVSKRSEAVKEEALQQLSRSM